MSKHKRKTPKVIAPPEPVVKRGVGQRAVAETSTPPAKHAFMMTPPLPGVLPQGVTEDGLAKDYGISDMYGFAQTQNLSGVGVGWIGYPALAEMAQLPEYRQVTETIAEEMTRKWIKLSATGKSDKTQRIGQLEDAMRKFDVQGIFRKATEHAGYFGRGQIYIDLGASETENELPLIISKAKIGKGSLKGLHTVEPFWTYPVDYDSSNPLSPDFYRPRAWFVMGKKISASRFMTFIPRPVSDILKPAYQFGGLSMTQMVQTSTEYFLNNRDSVESLLHAFSVMVLATDMSVVLQGGGAESINMRSMLFNQLRDNKGVMAIDKDSEEMTNVSAPLAGVEGLLAQAQEGRAAQARIPLIKLLGISPSGLNASSEGEIRAFYDTIEAMQERQYRGELKRIMDIIQLSEFGEIDDEIVASFEPLWQMSELDRATLEKTRADTDAEYVNMAALDPEEVRTALAGDEDSRYHGLKGPAPEPPEEESNPTILPDPAAKKVKGG